MLPPHCSALLFALTLFLTVLSPGLFLFGWKWSFRETGSRKRMSLALIKQRCVRQPESARLLCSYNKHSARSINSCNSWYFYVYSVCTFVSSIIYPSILTAIKGICIIHLSESSPFCKHISRAQLAFASAGLNQSHCCAYNVIISLVREMREWVAWPLPFFLII